MLVGVLLGFGLVSQSMPTMIARRLDAYLVLRVLDNRHVPSDKKVSLSFMQPRFLHIVLLPVIPVLIIGLLAIPFANGEET